MVLIWLMVSGCTHPSYKPQQIDRNGVDIIYYNEGLKATLIKSQGNTDRYCDSPDTDVSESDSNNISLGLGTDAKKESINDQFGTTSQNLGGRNPEVLIVRELMYRACELSANINATPDKTVEIYQMFLNNLTQLYQSSSSDEEEADDSGYDESTDDYGYDESIDDSEDEEL